MKKRQKLKIKILKLFIFISLIVVSISMGCGVSTPREYHEVAKSDFVEINENELSVNSVNDNISADVQQDVRQNYLMDASVDLTDAQGVIYVGLGLSTVPAMPISHLLGLTQKEVESLLSEYKPKDADGDTKKPLKADKKLGWICYNKYLKIRYVDHIVIEFEQKVPKDKTCIQSALWLGFATAKEPIVAKDSCVWPKNKQENELGSNGEYGELSTKSRLFSAHLEQ